MYNYILHKLVFMSILNDLDISINYFKHSKNPDFSDLTYDSKNFSYKFLGEGKGNIYLTQRFEFERKN